MERRPATLGVRLTRYEDMFRTTFDAHLLQFGEQEDLVTTPFAYTRFNAGTPLVVNINAEFTPQRVVPENVSDARQFVDGGFLEFQLDALGTGIAPDLRDFVTHPDSTVYAVVQITQRTPRYQVALEERVSVRKGGDNSRKPRT